VCRRFDPAYSLLKERVRQGEVGHVQTMKVCSRDSPLPTIAYLRTSGTIPDWFQSWAGAACIKGSAQELQKFFECFPGRFHRHMTDRRHHLLLLFFIVVILSWLGLSPLGTATTTGLLYQPQMIDDGDCWAIGGMKIGRGNRSTRGKSAPAPQIPHDQNRGRTRATAVGSQRLTAWAMPRPSPFANLS
jgi:hypothetical protein